MMGKVDRDSSQEVSSDMDMKNKVIKSLSIKPRIWKALEIVSDGYGVSASELAETFIWDGLQKLAKEIVKLEGIKEESIEEDDGE